MPSLHRNESLLLILCALGGALLFHPAGAVTLCSDLPPSTLRVYDIKASAVDAVGVPIEELEPKAQTEALASRHTLMLTASDIVTWFQIAHRIVRRTDGSVCDAPTLVQMGFGSSRRLAFLASAAAADPCVRQKMLDHEAAHTRALDEVVDRFIEQQQSNLQRGMQALKQTPAASVAIAKARWEMGVSAIVTEAKRQLVIELAAESDQIDAPAALAELENACGGKVRQLELSTGP